MAVNAFPINPELSAVAIGWKNPDVTLIADRVLPRIQKGGKLFNYTRYTQADAYTVPNTRVGRKSRPTELDFSGALIPATCVDWGLDALVPVDEIMAWEAMPKPASGGPVSPEAKNVELLTSLIELDREVRVANLVFNTASYAAGQTATLSGTSQWSDFANSNPLSAIMAALDVPVMRPNKMVVGQATWTQLRQHPRVIQAVFGTAQTGGVVSRQALADVLEISEILVGAGFVNTARIGQTPTLSRVWGKHCSLIYVSENAAAADQPSYGFTGEFGNRIAGAMDEMVNGLRGSRRVRVGETLTEIISAPETGYYFQNAVA